MLRKGKSYNAIDQFSHTKITLLVKWYPIDFGCEIHRGGLSEYM